MQEINKNIYLDRMRASMREKLFWLPMISDTRLIIDFGCADGELLSQLEELNCYPYLTMVGVDHEESFIKLAKTKVNYGKFFHNVDELLMDKALNRHLDILVNKTINGSPIFNLSSVLHELYSFCSKEEIDKILLAATKCKYITIRDMLKPSIYLSSDSISESNNRANLESITAADNLAFASLCNSYPDKVAEFFKNKPHTKDNDVQFMLKCMYLNNWDSEVKEDYFSVDWKYIDKFFKDHGFELMYKNDYSNEYVSNKLQWPGLITHRQLIYRKKA